MSILQTVTTWLSRLTYFGRRMRYNMGCGECEQCGSEDAAPYWYDIDTMTILCEDHAKGLFCLYCGSFTGGTEEAFIYGDWECDSCRGWRDEFDDDYDDDEDWYDDDLDFGFNTAYGLHV